MPHFTWMTKSQAAQRLQVTPKTIERWAAAGRITRYNSDGMKTVRYRSDEVDALLQPVPPTREEAEVANLEEAFDGLDDEGRAMCGECEVAKTQWEFYDDGGCCSARANDYGNRWPGEQR